MQGKGNNKRIWLIPFAPLILALFLLLLSNKSKAFADYYTAYIFPKISYPYCFLTGLLPFSLGEFMLYLAVVLVAAFIVGLIIFLLVKAIRKKPFPSWFKVYSLVLWYITGIFTLVMVLNCFIMYQSSEMESPQKLSKDIHPLSFSEYFENPLTDDMVLMLVRDYVVTQLNELSLEFERDENGYIIGYPGLNDISVINKNIYANPSDEYKVFLSDASKKAMQHLSDNGIERLSGGYPKPKYLWQSEFFSQQHMMGYYFPFSMESNLNDCMYAANYPFTICHELSHLKGYIREDEANFIAYLACINSDDLFFVYSGYLGVLNYLDNDFYNSINRDKDIYLSHVQINELVMADDIFLTEEAWDSVEKNKVVDTETVHKASNTFTETVLTTNGVKDGMRSYNRVVQLLIEYYR